MRSFAYSRTSVFQALISTNKIRVRPNDHNQILIETLENDEKKDISESTQINCFSGCPCVGRCARMEHKIIKLAFGVLEKIKRNQIEVAEKEHFKKRIENIENTLNNISNKISVLMK